MPLRLIRLDVPDLRADCSARELRAKAVTRVLWLLLLALLVASCVSCKSVEATPAPTLPIAATADTARQQERARLAERDAQTLAAVHAWLARIPDLSDDAWRSEFALLVARYRDVTPSADHSSAATARVNAWADGRTVEAQSLTTAATEAAKVSVDALLAERAARVVAEERERQSRADSARQIAALERAIEAAKNQVLRDQVAKWNKAGFACEGAAVLCIGLGFAFGGLAALRKLGPIALFLGACGLLCFGIAQIVGHRYFIWGCAAVLLIVFTWAGVFVYRHYKQGDLKKEIDARAAKVTAVLGDVVGGVEAVRAKLKSAGTITKAEADKLLREWVTEDDGTAAVVDHIRREKKLIT